ncbi:MAG TPA: septation regulator SpoVG [bacterium]|nr:septation regulator SpoVG [bacterium]HOL47012.1 septation regulator SpoVG [bacterium]HPQ18486.1 septation regulator SpoVG [bacterium]
MNISEVRVKAVQSRNGKLKGWASVTFDNAFVIHNMKIIEGKSGKFVAMPNRKTKEGGYKDIAHPINNEMRKLIETKVLGEYEKVAASTSKSETKSSDTEVQHL